MNCIHLADDRGQNVASCSTKRYEFLECMTENDFFKEDPAAQRQIQFQLFNDAVSATKIALFSNPL